MKHDKKWKNSRHSPFLVSSMQPRSYHFFIVFLSIFFRFQRKQRKMIKNYQKMKKKKRWKHEKTRDIHHFCFFFEATQNWSFFHHFSCFNQFSSVFQENKGKWIKTIRKWWKMFKKWKLETFTIFGFFRCSPECIICLSFFSCFINFLSFSKETEEHE